MKPVLKGMEASLNMLMCYSNRTSIHGNFTNGKTCTSTQASQRGMCWNIVKSVHSRHEHVNSLKKHIWNKKKWQGGGGGSISCLALQMNGEKLRVWMGRQLRAPGRETASQKATKVSHLRVEPCDERLNPPARLLRRHFFLLQQMTVSLAEKEAISIINGSLRTRTMGRGHHFRCKYSTLYIRTNDMIRTLEQTS